MALDALVGEYTSNSINDDKYNNTVFYSYAECRYAERRATIEPLLPALSATTTQYTTLM
jgi:hypothetical protein